MTTKIRQFVLLLCTSSLLASSPLILPLVNPLRASAEEYETNEGPIKGGKISYLTICNKNSQYGNVDVAIATRRESGWISEGWYRVSSNTCIDIRLGYYEGKVMYYAKSSNGYTWTSDNTFCISQGRAFKMYYSKRDYRASCDDKSQVGVGMREDYVKSGRGLVNL